MSKKVSIYDIAKLSKVSPASVSYVINGVNKVSKETKQKILDAIDELGYVLDNNARTLSTGKSRLIGLCLPLDEAYDAFIQNPFYVEFIAGLERGVGNSQYDIVVKCFSSQENFKSWVISRSLDGLVMLGKYPKIVYDELKKTNIPIVLIDVYEEYAKEFNNIRIDDEKGCYDATKYMIENGHKKIGFVGKLDSLVDRNRFNGYLKALKDHNIEYFDDYLFECYATYDDGIKIAGEIINRNNVTGVICSGDIIAIAIIKKYIEEGKNIPDNLSIIGFDDIRDAKYIYPSLTTIKQDIVQKGELAAKILLKQFQAKEKRNIMKEIKTELIIRDTVKKL